jgi:hypothetical protein
MALQFYLQSHSLGVQDAGAAAESAHASTAGAATTVEAVGVVPGAGRRRGARCIATSELGVK